MKLLGDKILVRITKENRESIFSKEIKREDGTTFKLFINVPALDAIDERRSSLFVQTAMVEAVALGVEGVQVGDTAIVDYRLCNMDENLFQEDENGEVYWLNATSTYHRETAVAYANQRSPRDQIIHMKGELDEMSMLLGVIRGDKMIARMPFVFLENEPTVIKMHTLSGIEYNQKQTILKRKVLAIDDVSAVKYKTRVGDEIYVYDRDVFMIELDGKKIDCVNDEDIKCSVEEVASAVRAYRNGALEKEKL